MQPGPPVSPPSSTERNRLNLTLSDDLNGVLDHVAGVLGIPKTALVLQAVVQSLPGWIEQAQTVRQAAKAQGQQQQQGHKKK